MTNKMIREYCGHNGNECRVVICRDGTIRRYGSTVDTDRTKDFWAVIGTVDSVTHEIYHTMVCVDIL
jgi:hypothetical protein